MESTVVANLLDTQRMSIAEYAVAAQLRDAFWVERFGANIDQRLILDINTNLAVLTKSIRYRSPMIFDDHMLWRRNQVVGLGCTTSHVREVFAHIVVAIQRYLPAESHHTVYVAIQSAMQILNYQNPTAQALAMHHEQLARDLVAATFDSHWHWQTAYGSEGAKLALYDAAFTIDYLIDAFGQNQPTIFSERMLWMRNRLNSCGLSTTHTLQQLWLLYEAIAQRTPHILAETQALLQFSSAQITNQGEACRQLLAAQDAIIAELCSSSNDFPLSIEQLALEVGWLLAYLSDSLADADPARLTHYLSWVHHRVREHNLPAYLPEQLLSALDEAITHHLPQPIASNLQQLLKSAQAAP